MLKVFFSLLVALLFPFFSISQQLGLRDIMEGQDFIGYWPTNPKWSPDSKSFTFSWRQEEDSILESYKYDLKSGLIERLANKKQQSLPGNGQFNRERDKYLYTKFGDIFIYYPKEDYTEKITKTKSIEHSAHFNFDETAVIFTKTGELFRWDLFDGSLTQLSNFGEEESQKRNKSDLKSNLEKEQLQLISVLKERKQKRELIEELSKEGLPIYPPAFSKKSGSITGMSLSADERHILFIQREKGSGIYTEVPNYITEDGFTDSRNARVKVGSDTNHEEIWILSLDSGKYQKVDFSALPGYSTLPDYYSDYDRVDSIYSPKVKCHGPYTSEEGEHIIYLLKSEDNKSRWIVEINLDSVILECLVYERDEAWIGGPGISGWNTNAGLIGFLPGSNSFYYQSEKSGYSHLHLFDMDTKIERALTSGSWEVLNAVPSMDGRSFYLEASAEDPFTTSLYELSTEAGASLEKLSDLGGANKFLLSPDNKHFLITHSTPNKPWELYLKRNKNKSVSERITHSTRSAFEDYKWRIPEIVTFTAADGAEVPARIYRPGDSLKTAKAVIFVHGAGYLHNVHNWWSNYYREYMFHNLLTDKGYTVLDIDYRGSAGYGRDWRAAIYRYMGGKDLSDQLDGAKYLIDSEGINENSIGIYGGSYGGFITLMALFNHPGTFSCGAALRSVTDWAHYNHPYTSNILNTPVLDSIAYRRSSPIYFAEGLQDDLLICHGILDDNVQFQDVVRLSQRLIELEKDNWEMALFPLEPHGFKEASSWYDEYRRILKLFEEKL